MPTKNQSPATTPEGVQQPEQIKAPELLEIGELRKKHKVGQAVFAGVCATQEWRPGKQIDEETFLKAVSDFTGAPMNGQLRAKESEGKR